MKIRHLFILSLLIGVLASASRVVPTAHAATITVDTLTDENDGSCTDGDCSLRDAIAVANAGDTINFSVTGTIVLTPWGLAIAKNLTISGPGATSLTISGNNTIRVFYISDGLNVSISGVTIANGSDPTCGGGIRTEPGGTLTLTNSTISSNHSGLCGGAIYNYYGTLIVTNSTFSDNSANSGGICNWGGTLTATNSIFSGNSASDDGGGIDNSVGSRATVTKSTFSSNSAINGGGICTWDTLNVTDSTFSSNNADDWGGGICINGGTVTVTNSTLSGNGARDGGGIRNWGRLDLTKSTFSDNTANDGGGIRNTGTLNVTNSSFSGNSATNEGGGICTWGGLTMTNSTFSGNSASSGGGIYSLPMGVVLRNTIVANSTSGGDCNSMFPFAGGSTNNLSTDDTCSPGFTQVTSTQLALGTLSGNPAYMPLNPGSVAIDTGTNDGCPATDQRGWPRPQDGDGDGTAVCDVGSYEFSTTPTGTATPPSNLIYLPIVMKNYTPQSLGGV